MKRRANKLLALILVAAMVLAMTPVNALAAYDNICIHGTITWHGGDPSPIAILVNTKNYSTLFETYDNTRVIYNDVLYNGVQGYPQLYLSPTTYNGKGEWTLYYELHTQYHNAALPFVAILESSLTGKWYCDKWDWNNVIWQPGQYAPKDGSYLDKEADLWVNTYLADFFLTCSESATKSITFNRSFSSGTTAVDSTLSLYRYYSISNRYELIKTSALIAGASSITFDNLYSGQYAIMQTLQANYSDTASATCSGITDLCFQADLTTASSASLSSTTSKDVPKTITVSTLTGGTITPNVTQAYPGDTVSLTIAPNDYMRLKAGTLQYTDGTGSHAISGTSFVMPNDNVTISAQFEPTLSVAVAALTDGTVTPSVTTASPGETVNLTVTPDTNKQLKAGTLKYTDGTGDHDISGTSFLMPESDVTISAEFEPKQYTVSVATLTGGVITPDKTLAVSGDQVNLTISPNPGIQLQPGTLQYTYGSNTMPITGTAFEMPQSDVTISAQFQIPVSITTDTLPEGMFGNPYSATVVAQDGSPSYTWSAQGLPDGLSIDAGTGEISGTPTENGSFDVALTVTDTGGTTSKKTLSLYINERCGNGAYLITPDTSANYSWGYGDGGSPAMTVGSGVSGFRTFSVSVKSEQGHTGDEALLFVHMRNGAQIAISANFADFDSIKNAKAAFNVKPGDIIKVYIVDDLSSDAGLNPNIL